MLSGRKKNIWCIFVTKIRFYFNSDIFYLQYVDIFYKHLKGTEATRRNFAPSVLKII
jgi:hypothetical protein